MKFDQPSLGNIENAHNNEYEEILNEVEKIINNPDQIKEFIARRLEKLKSESSKVEIGAMHKQWYQGFIHPDSSIRRSYMVDPFRVDDDSIYEEMFSVIKKFKEHPGWKDMSIRSIMPFIIQHTVVNYFGNIASNSETERNNEVFYVEHDDPNMPEISIKELKSKKIAVCAEKSAVSENLASFMGLESYLIVSNTFKGNPDDNEKGALHAYNIWKTTKGHFIYDPTNPMLNLEKETNKILSYNPAVYPITGEEFKKIKEGGTVIVKSEGKVSDSERSIHEIKTTERVYGGYKK